MGSVTKAAVIDRLAALVALVILGAEDQNFPSDAFWESVSESQPWIKPALILVAGLFALSPFTSLGRRRVSSKREITQRLILFSLGKIINEYQAIAPVTDYRQVGLHIWRVHRPPSRLFRSRLQRVSTYRLSGDVSLRNFAPRRGEGVIGMCWQLDTEFRVNVEELANKLRTKLRFETARNSRGGDYVMNLSWQTFEAVRHRGAVFATPMRDSRGRFIGCVSVDFPQDFDLILASEVPRLLNSLSEDLKGREFQEM